MVVRKFYTKIQ